MRKIYYVSLLLLVIISSCSKSKNDTSPILTGPSKNGTALDLIKDSVYLYTKEESLWYDQIPTYAKFQPRSFTDPEDFTALQKEMDALSQYPINPASGKPYELSNDHPGEAKYSFIDDGSVSNELNGTNGDFGFNIQWDDPNNLSDLRVIYVYPNSPADKAGIKRGDKITNINGRTSLSYDASGYGSGTSVNLNFVAAALDNSNTISIILTQHDGTTLTVTDMAIANYTINPVLKETVLNQGNGKKIGYLVFNVFTAVDNAGPQLDAAFADFASKGITDLVVDLRYNGGGDVATAEYLDNLIVPSSASGTNMYTATYNSQLQKGIYPLLATQYNIPTGYFTPTYPLNHPNFSKKGNLDINRVFFIITSSTASAAELTINNLRPHMTVKYIGTTSYGKPVGFFEIPIGKYGLYTPEFATVNSAGQGGYYDGFTPGTTTYPGILADDDETTDFGDPKEGLLSLAINYVNTGSFTTSSSQSVNSFALGKRSFSADEKRSMLLKMKKNKFMGMVFRDKLKLKGPVRK